MTVQIHRGRDVSMAHQLLQRVRADEESDESNMEMRLAHHRYMGFLGKYEIAFNERIDDFDPNTVEL